MESIPVSEAFLFSLLAATLVGFERWFSIEAFGRYLGGGQLVGARPDILAFRGLLPFP